MMRISSPLADGAHVAQSLSSWIGIHNGFACRSSAVLWRNLEKQKAKPGED